MLGTLIQKAILGYLSQYHNNSNTLFRVLYAGLTPFRGANVTWCDTPFRVNFRGWWTRVGSQLMCGRSPLPRGPPGGGGVSTPRVRITLKKCSSVLVTPLTTVTILFTRNVIHISCFVSVWWRHASIPIISIRMLINEIGKIYIFVTLVHILLILKSSVGLKLSVQELDYESYGKGELRPRFKLIQ